MSGCVGLDVEPNVCRLHSATMEASTAIKLHRSRVVFISSFPCRLHQATTFQ